MLRSSQRRISMAVKGSTAIDTSGMEAAYRMSIIERMTSPIIVDQETMDGAMFDWLRRPGPPPQEIPMPPTPGKTAVLVSDTAPDPDYVALATELGVTCPD